MEARKFFSSLHCWDADEGSSGEAVMLKCPDFLPRPVKIRELGFFSALAAGADTSLETVLEGPTNAL